MMRLSTLLILLPFAVISACASSRGEGKNKDKEKTVSGTVTFVEPYCGGAAPSEAMERTRMEGTPYANKQMYVRRSGENKNAEPIWQKFTTDAQGKYSFELEEGEYCIIEERKRDFNAITTGLRETKYRFDEKCLSEWFSQCDRVVKIGGKDQTGVDITLNGRCDWQGPVPCVDTGMEPPR